MKKTLGGDRLGAGKKMQVEMHGYERSTHDMGYLWRSTMAAGTLVPFLSELALPGDTFDIDLDCDIKTHPTVGPLFGSYKIQLDVFLAPMRLYSGMLHNNQLGIGMNMANVPLPIMTYEVPATTTELDDIDNSQINPSCILSYLGLRGLGMAGTTTERAFNAIPLLAYWEIYKNYYANKQEEIGAVIHADIPPQATIDDVTIADNPLPEGEGSTGYFVNGSELQIIGATELPDYTQIEFFQIGVGWVAYSLFINWTQAGNTWIAIGYDPANAALITGYRYIGAGTTVPITPQVKTFDLSNIDRMRQYILSNGDSVFDIFVEDSLLPYYWLKTGQESEPFRPNIMNTQEGLGIKTYQSDLFNNWLQTEWIDGVNGISAVTAISTVGDSFTLDTLNLAKKVYDMLNRIAVSGGSYDDWMDAVYSHDRYKRAESPMYMGGLSKELVFQEVISNTATGEQPLGTLAGKGVMAKKHKGGKVVINVDEPSYIMGIISLTPRIDYSQGNKWDLNLKTMDDLHKPALDEIGFQDLITEQMAWWDTSWDGTKWVQKSAGKQPAWLNYMTNVNQTRGNFAIQDNEMFMTLNRRYETEGIGNLTTIKDLTTYIDPAKYNFIFAQTSLDAQNFWAQIAVDITARRKMSAKVMPNV